MATGVTSNNTRPQPAARYRVNEHGTHVVIVPTRCPSGRHLLTASGYRIIETSETLTVTCQECAGATHPDHSWVLATDGRRVQSAEFHDTPYAGLLRGATK